jgi:uncharacterized protein HemX
MLRTVASANPGNDILTFYYLVGAIATALGVAYGVLRFYARQRDRWTQEGKQRAEQAAAVEANSEKLEENTKAIAVLTQKLDDFIGSVRTELNGLGHRVNRLEDYRGEPPAGQRRDRRPS